MNNQMNKKKAVVAFIALLTCALAGQALAQGQEIEFKSNADDLTKIRSVLEEFRQDIIHKDGYALTKLVLNPDVLFHHINNQEEVDSARKYTAQFDGIGPSQLDGFAKLLATSKDKLEEKFRRLPQTKVFVRAGPEVAHECILFSWRVVEWRFENERFASA